MTTATTRLTGHDRRTIALARDLAGFRDSDMLRLHLAASGIMTPSDRADDTHAFAFGAAQSLLRLLADLAERLGGDDA